MSARYRFVLLAAQLLVAMPLLAQDYAGKRVFYVNSYHAGYPASDKTHAAIVRTLSGRGISFKAWELDTKRHSNVQQMKAAARRAKDAIDAFKPDVVIISDDNAAKYVLARYYAQSAIPFVFCCINWDASIYGLPYKNTTGMVEVVLVGELMRHLRKYTKGARIGFLGGDRYSERRNREYYEKRFHVTFEKTYFAETFSQWKSYFRRLQDEVDILLLTSHAGVSGWDDDQARDFVDAHIKVPVGTEHEWEMPYALVGVAKDFDEMGTWVAHTALRILDGVAPHAIPITANKKGKLYFNLRIAKKLGVSEIPPLAVIVD